MSVVQYVLTPKNNFLFLVLQVKMKRGVRLEGGLGAVLLVFVVALTAAPLASHASALGRVHRMQRCVCL
jgi:hypothetical protein